MSEQDAGPRCPNCGNTGPSRGRSFCEVCGDFVDWEAVAARAVPPPATPPPAPRAPAPRPPAASPPSTGQSAVRPPSTGRGAVPPPLSDTSVQRRERARELIVPLAEQVDPVLPGRPEPPRPEARPAMATEESGTTCWNCGVGNRSDRRFCRNCGVDLSAAPAPAPAPAGNRRPAPSRRWWVLGISALVLAGLVVLGVLLLPDLLARPDVVVPPIQAVASQEDPEHPPASAVDDRAESWWGTGADQDPAGAALTVTFGEPFDLHSTRIVPGVSDRDEDRENQHRPQQIDVTVEDEHGREQTFSVRLEDGGPQVIPTPVDATTRVTVVVRSAYTSGRGNQVAISDIRFRGPGD